MYSLSRYFNKYINIRNIYLFYNLWRRYYNILFSYQILARFSGDKYNGSSDLT